jgi:hypothetical protein
MKKLTSKEIKQLNGGPSNGNFKVEIEGVTIGKF